MLPTRCFSRAGWSQCMGVNSRSPACSSQALLPSAPEASVPLPAHPASTFAGPPSLQPLGTSRKLNKYLPQKDKVEERCVSAMTGEISLYRCFGDEMHKAELAQVFCFTERAKAPQASAAKPTEGLALSVSTALRKRGLSVQTKQDNR